MRTLFICAALLALLALPFPALADCPEQPEAGNWVNEYAKATSLASIELEFFCQDQIKDGRPYPPGPDWIMHVHGRCEPFNCDWGETAPHRLSTGHIYAIYDQGFAIRHVYAKMSRFRNGLLWVYTWTDFKDPKRPDYGVHDWFKRR